jgi:hypothetical protein
VSLAEEPLSLPGAGANSPPRSPFVPNLDEPTAANDTNEPYLPYYRYLLSQPNSKLPQVISNSYGDDEQVWPPNTPFHTLRGKKRGRGG